MEVGHPRPELSNDICQLPVERRCGRPYEIDYLYIRKYLSWDNLNMDKEVVAKEFIGPFVIVKSIFESFWRSEALERELNNKPMAEEASDFGSERGRRSTTSIEEDSFLFHSRGNSVHAGFEEETPSYPQNESPDDGEISDREEGSGNHLQPDQHAQDIEKPHVEEQMKHNATKRAADLAESSAADLSLSLDQPSQMLSGHKRQKTTHWPGAKYNFALESFCSHISKSAMMWIFHCATARLYEISDVDSQLSSYTDLWRREGWTLWILNAFGRWSNIDVHDERGSIIGSGRVAFLCQGGPPRLWSDILSFFQLRDVAEGSVPVLGTLEPHVSTLLKRLEPQLFTCNPNLPGESMSQILDIVHVHSIHDLDEIL